MATQKTEHIRDNFQYVLTLPGVSVSNQINYSDMINVVERFTQHVRKTAAVIGSYEIYQPESGFYMSFDVSSKDTIEDNVWELAAIFGEAYQRNSKPYVGFDPVYTNMQTRFNAENVVKVLAQLLPPQGP